MHVLRSAVIVAVICLSAGWLRAEFMVGHVYSTNSFYDGVIEYDLADGQQVGSMPFALGQDSFGGIAFGPDGHLYAAIDNWTDNLGRVVAMDSSGVVVEAYDFGDLGEFRRGQIAFGAGGAFYVSGDHGVLRAAIGSHASATSIYSNPVEDIAYSGSGSLYVTDTLINSVVEISTAGVVLRTVAIVDPGNVLFRPLEYPRGVAYDPVGNDLFVTADYAVVKIDAATGVVLAAAESVSSDPSDLFLAGDRLVLGDDDRNGGIYDLDLNLVTALEYTAENHNITVYVASPVPEPSTALLLSAVWAYGVGRRRRVA
jgi:DNA-binding beta-propeller fold protein YncE